MNRNYTVKKEWCGHLAPRWVVRLCGEWLASYESRADALAFVKRRSCESFRTTPATIVAEHEAEMSFINAQGFARASRQVTQ